MANITPTPTYDDIIEIDTFTRVQGGPGGPANFQAQNIANRFAYLEGDAGAAKIGYDGAKVADVLNSVRNVTDYAALRTYSGTATGFQVTGLLATAQPQGINGRFELDTTDTTSGAYFTGSVSGTTLSVTSVINGAIAIGLAVNRGDTGATVGYITAGSGLSWTLSASATVPSMTMSADNGGTVIVRTSDGVRVKRDYVGPAQVKWFGAVGSGDEYWQIQSALNSSKHVQSDVGSSYLISAPLTTQEGSVFESVGAAPPFPGGGVTATALITVNSNLASVINVGNNGIIRGITTSGSQGLVGNYAIGNYPATLTNNPEIGINAGTDCRVVECFATQSRKGIVGAGQTIVYHSSASYCDKGITTGSDGAIIFCDAVLCATYGLYTSGSYVRIQSNRSEQNGGYGIYSASGETIVVGNVLDRNALAGVFLTSAWGGVICGNYFARNGAGGDGTSGRWGFSVPGDPSYIEVGSADSVHIKLYYCKDVAIAGNRYRSGLSDANDGANSPAHIYNVDSTTGNNAVDIAGEANLLGYNTAYPLVSAGDSSGVFAKGASLITPISYLREQNLRLNSGTESERAYLISDPNLNTGNRILGGLFAGSNGAVDNTHCGVYVSTIGGTDSYRIINFRHQHPTRGREQIAQISYNGDFQTNTHAYDRGRINLGNYFIWVDTTGKLRIKNGAPTSDTDGTVVGTQS